MESQAKVSIQMSTHVNGVRGGGMSHAMSGEFAVESDFASLLFQSQRSQSFDFSNNSMTTLMSTTDSMVASTKALKSADEQNRLHNQTASQASGEGSDQSPASQARDQERQTERQHQAATGNQVPQTTSQPESANTGATAPVQREQSVEQTSQTEQSSEDTEHAQSTETEQTDASRAVESKEVELEPEVDPLLVVDTSDVTTDPEADGSAQPLTIAAATVQNEVAARVTGQSVGQRKVSMEMNAHKSADILSSDVVSEVDAEVDAKLSTDLELDLKQEHKSKQLLDDLMMKMDQVTQRFTQGLGDILAKTPQGRGQLSADASFSGQLKSLAVVQSALHSNSTSQSQLKSAISTEQSTFNVSVEKPNWGDAIRNRVTWMVNQGLQKAQIQLHPAELGALNVRVEVNADETHVTFTAQTAIAREALETEMGRLRELFQQQGIQLGETSVYDQNQQQAKSHSEVIEEETLPGVDQSAEPIVQDHVSHQSTAAGLLDLYA